MNVKKKLKALSNNFKNNSGFTLVELIVVIAILAILGGVAVPAYSGYVKKANKQADIMLVSDIERALTLAGYDGTFTDSEGGYIVLSTNGIVNASDIAESNLEKALIAAFGTNYADMMKLKYDGWSSNGLYNNLNPETAIAVKESSYLTGNRADDLLVDVETMTGMANNLVTALAAGNGFLEGTTLSKMFTLADGNCVLDTTAAKYGITKDADETWEQWAARNDGANQNAYSNLLVLAAADESERFMSTMGQVDQYQMSGASNMILEFSQFYGYAAQNPEFSIILDEYLGHLNGEESSLGLADVTDANTGKKWYDSLKAAAGPGYDAYLSATNATTGANQSFVDQSGFLSILSGIGNPSAEQAKLIASDINNANLFTNGIVNDMYNDYLDGVDAMAGAYVAGTVYDGLGLDSGNVVVLFSNNNGKSSVMNSLPSE